MIDVAVTSMRPPRKCERLTAVLAEAIESRVADVLAQPFPLLARDIERKIREKDRRLHFRVTLADDVEKVERFGFGPELRADLINHKQVEIGEALERLELGLRAFLVPRRSDLCDKDAGFDEERGTSGLVGTAGNGAGKMRFPCAAPAEKDERVTVIEPRIDVAAEVRHSALHCGLLGRLGDVARDGRLSVAARDRDAPVGLLGDHCLTTGRTGVEEHEAVGARAASEGIAAVLRAVGPLGDVIAILQAESFALLGRRVRIGSIDPVRTCSRFLTAGAGRQISAETAELFHNFFLLQRRRRRGTPNRARCT